jgi:hypothetical protein
LQAVNGLGKGILSAVLLVIYPSEFGVWNRISEASLKLLDIWPEFDQGASSGKRYKAINDVLHQLKDRLGLDLWVLDSVEFKLGPPVKSEQKLPFKLRTLDELPAAP